MQARKALGKRIGLGVDDEVDLALAVERDVLVPVARHRFESHGFKGTAHDGRLRCCVFDELEAVGAHRVVPGGGIGSRRNRMDFSHCPRIRVKQVVVHGISVV